MARFVELKVVQFPLGDEADVIGLSEAARLLGLKHASGVSDLCYRGVLRRVLDMSEPNPRKRGRVFRADVLAELARRRGERKDDSRLRRPVGGGAG